MDIGSFQSDRAPVVRWPPFITPCIASYSGSIHFKRWRLGSLDILRALPDDALYFHAQALVSIRGYILPQFRAVAAKVFRGPGFAESGG
jgi:hypothetical protein